MGKLGSTAILIVEDDALNASYISEVLQESGYVVAGVASTGAEALSLTLLRQPILALVDIRIAGPMDGIELACKLRDEHRVPTIFLSGLADQESITRAAAASPLGFLAKPFRPSTVFNTIERALERRRTSEDSPKDE